MAAGATSAEVLNASLLEASLEELRAQPDRRSLVDELIVRRIVPLHFGLRCRGCAVAPMVGPRYTCNDCDDFHFCAMCYEGRGHAHRRDHAFVCSEVAGISKKPCDVAVGSSVIVCGTGRTQHDGRPGVVRRQVTSSRSWEVEIDGVDSTVAVDAGKLVLRPPPPPLLLGGTQAADGEVGLHAPREYTDHSGAHPVLPRGGGMPSDCAHDQESVGAPACSVSGQSADRGRLWQRQRRTSSVRPTRCSTAKSAGGRARSLSQRLQERTLSQQSRLDDDSAAAPRMGKRRKSKTSTPTKQHACVPSDQQVIKLSFQQGPLHCSLVMEK